jgi:hypothetical protein
MCWDGTWDENQSRKILQKIAHEVSESFSPPGEGGTLDNLVAYHPSATVLRLHLDVHPTPFAHV